MKYPSVILVILCLVLTCTACCRINAPTADAIKPPAPQTATEPTDAVPTTTPKQEIPFWYNEDPHYLSYDEFFATDRPLTSYRHRNAWYVCQDDTLYHIRLDWNSIDAKLSVQSSDGSHTVPNCDNLAGFSLIGSDGHYACLNSATNVIQIDLFTGQQQTVLTCERLIDIFLLDGVVLYYCAEDAGLWNIYQMYLPTLDVDILYKGIPADTPPYFFNLLARQSTRGPVSWSMLNPETTAILRKELADPDSIYKINNFREKAEPDDFSSIWDKMDLDSTDGNNAPPYMLLHSIQNHTGIHNWVTYTYNPADGTCEKSTAIIDNCWYGSGYSHDHSDPHEYDMTPEWNVSEELSVTNISLPEDPQKLYEEDLFAFQNTNYARIANFICRETEADVFQILFDIDLKEIKFAPDYIYGITPDNTIIQVSYDGTVQNTVYSADDVLSELVYGSGKLYFMDGNTIMEIDIPAKTCRSLLNIPQYTYFRMYLDDHNVLFFECSKGLSVSMYLADFTEMALTETHRL